MKCHCGRRMKCIETRHIVGGTRRRYRCVCSDMPRTTMETTDTAITDNTASGAKIGVAVALLQQALTLLPAGDKT